MVLTAPPATGSSPGSKRRGIGRLLVLFTLGAAGAVAAAFVGGSLARHGPAPLPASAGITEDHLLPPSVLHAPLVDEQGRPTTLESLRGRIVVLVPFLTSCQEVCPLTTAALLEAERSLTRAHMSGRVAIVEVSLDPGRDVPSRLAAYAGLTGATWPLLTGTPAVLHEFWHALGVYVQQVPEAAPPGFDWQTGMPYTYDVDHTDGFFLLGTDLHERFLTVSAPDVRGATIPAALRAMLDAEGLDNLHHPKSSSWTVAQLLQGIGWLTGRAVPEAA